VALAQTRKNLVLGSELLALLKLFSDSQIDVLPLKGPVLAEQVYGSVALRRMRDLDLLVKQEDLERVITLLEGRGYRLPRARRDCMDKRWLQASHELPPLFSRQTGTLIEVHHALLVPRGRKRFGLEELTARTRRSLFMNAPVLTLEPEDLLVYLSEHGTGHAWERLEWICCISELLRSGQVKDWDRVAEFADRFGSRKRLAGSLLLAHELLGAPLTPACLEASPSVRKAVQSLTARLRGESMEQNRLVRLLRQQFYVLAMDDGFGMQFDRCCKMLVPQFSDFRDLPLPRPLWPLYYVIRPLRGAIKYTYRYLAALRRPSLGNRS
jgi:hypothetical protein